MELVLADASVEVRYLPSEPTMAVLVGQEPERSPSKEPFGVIAMVGGVVLFGMGVAQIRRKARALPAPVAPEEMLLMIARGEEQFGPYLLEEVRARLRAGQVLPTDLAWREGMGDWVPVASLFGAGGALIRNNPPQAI